MKASLQAVSVYGITYNFKTLQNFKEFWNAQETPLLHQYFGNSYETLNLIAHS